MLPDPDALTDEQVRKIYDMDGYSLSLEIARQRKETGLTFSQEALSDYIATLSTFVATRVMKYWNETGEPPVKMDTLVTVAINEKAEHPENALIIDENNVGRQALILCRRMLAIHSNVEMLDPKNKAEHAAVCQQLEDNIKVLEEILNG